MVTLTFDDGYCCHYDIVRPLLEKYEMSATFYVTTSLLGQPGYLTEEQVIALAQGGHEIASHGVTHRNFKKLSTIAIEKELLESKQWLEALLQIPVLNFAPPFGACHHHHIRLLKKYYWSNRSIISGLNELIPWNPFALHAYVVFPSTSPHEIERWIDQAIAEQKWLVLVYHQVNEIADPSEIVEITTAAFESQLQTIRQRGVVVKTMKEYVKDLIRN